MYKVPCHLELWRPGILSKWFEHDFDNYYCTSFYLFSSILQTAEHKDFSQEYSSKSEREVPYQIFWDGKHWRKSQRRQLHHREVSSLRNIRIARMYVLISKCMISAKLKLKHNIHNYASYKVQMKMKLFKKADLLYALFLYLSRKWICTYAYYLLSTSMFM